MNWLFATLFSYFLFAVVSLGDKYLLLGKPKAKIYAFYVGVLSVLVLLLIPFVGFFVPGIWQITLCFGVGLVFILSLIFLYQSLKIFEVSRIIPALGGFLPIFTFILSFLILSQKGFLEEYSTLKFFSFIFLISGSILISLEGSFNFSLKSLFFAGFSALLLSLYFVLSKLAFSDLGFWPGFIWIRLAVFFFALFLLFFKEVRLEIFAKRKSFTKKTGFLFLINQATGALAVILQNWAIALAGAVFLPFISALQGVQYVFLFILTILISLISPAILKEKVSSKIIFQKILAIIFIIAGLGALAF